MAPYPKLEPVGSLLLGVLVLAGLGHLPWGLEVALTN